MGFLIAVGAAVALLAVVVWATDPSNVISAPSTTIELPATSTTTSTSTEFGQPPVLDQETETNVYFVTAGRLTEVDIDARTVVVHRVPELAPGDPPHRLVRIGGDLVFFGQTDRGPAVFSVDPAAPGSPDLIDDAWFFIPSAAEDRIWLAILDESSPSTLRSLQAVREVTAAGQVTVEDVAPPNGRSPIAAVEAGLLFQGGEILELWDPDTREFIQVLPGPFAVATRGNKIVACSSCDRLDLIDLDTGTQSTVQLPPEVGSIGGYGGVFSPDGRYMAVPGSLSDDQQVTSDTPVGVVLVDTDTGTASLVPGMSQSHNGYPQVTWSSDGEWLFYSVGGLYAGTGRLFAHQPGQPSAYEVPVTLEGQYFGMATD